MLTHSRVGDGWRACSTSVTRFSRAGRSGNGPSELQGLACFHAAVYESGTVHEPYMPLHLHTKIRERWAATRSRVYDAGLHGAPCIAGNQFARTQEDDAVLLSLRKSTLSFARRLASRRVVYADRVKTSLRAKDGQALASISL